MGDKQQEEGEGGTLAPLLVLVPPRSLHSLGKFILFTFRVEVN